MEKPPILSDEQIREYYTVRLSANERVTSVDPLRLTRNMLLAQRDADVEWYKDKFDEGKLAGIREKQDIIEAKLNDVEFAIQQARQETAREIFEEIEKEQSNPKDGVFVQEGIHLTPGQWQSVKSKYLEAE